MSLESKIELLIAALNANTAALSGQVAAPAAPPAPPVAVAPVMPAPPTFAAPAPPAAPPSGVPFSDSTGLVAYATTTWGELEKKGAGRGAVLQQVLAQAGVQDANQIPATHYEWFYTTLEGLKAAP